MDSDRCAGPRVRESTRYSDVVRDRGRTLVVCGGCLDRFGPSDVGFPDTGIIALSTLDAPGWVYADIDIGAVRAVRADDVVLNRRHWVLQQGRTDPTPVTSLVD